MPLAFPAPAQRSIHWLFRTGVETENGTASHRIRTQSCLTWTAPIHHPLLFPILLPGWLISPVAMGCMKQGFQNTFRDQEFCGKLSLITLQNYYCWGQIYGRSWTLRRTLCCSQGTLRMPLGVFILACWCGCVCQAAFIFLHPNWCRWKILSTDLKPSGNSLRCVNQEPYTFWYLCEFGSIPPQNGPKE